MKPNTALAFAISGLSLALLLARPSRARAIAARSGAILVALVGAITLAEYATGLDLAIDDAIVAGAGRMSWITAGAFVVAGASLLLLDAPVRGAGLRASEAGAALLVLLGVFVMSIYAYESVLLAKDLTVALHTAALFFALAAGIGCARPDRGIAEIYWSDGPAGVLARTLLPAAIFVPPTLGFLRVRAQQLGYVDLEVGSSLVAATTVLLLGAVGVLAAVRVRALHEETERRARDLARANARVVEAEQATVRGSWEWDVTTDRARWSENMYRIFGLDPASFQNSNENFLALVHPDDRARMQQAIVEALARPGQFLQEYRLTRPDGVTRQFRGEGNVALDPDGKPRVLFGFVQDVTDRRALDESEARNREQARELAILARIAEFKTQFLRTAAHELRTPIQPVKTQLFLLKGARSGGLSEPQRASLDVIERNVERLGALVENVVSAAHHQSGTLALDVAQADLHATSRAAVESTLPLARARGVAVALETVGDATLSADVAKLEVAFVNLVNNAVKFTPSGGRVSVRSQGRADSFVLTVRDSGAGFRQEDLPRLFEPLSQLPSTHARTDAGAGLGLYLTRAVADLHGGSLVAESPGPGKGATFTLVIPRRPPGDDPPRGRPKGKA